MRKAQIENGVVVNMALVDPDNVPDWCKDWPDAPDDADIGQAFADGKFFALPAPLEPVPDRISFAQMVFGLVKEGWITEADGDGWLQSVLPPVVVATIGLLPEDQRFLARAKAMRPTYIDRDDKLVAMMALVQKRSNDDLDAFFSTYSKV